MDEIVEREYENLYHSFRDQYDLRNWVDEADKDLQAQRGQRLRADARYLLLINFAEMVVRPADQAKRVPPGEFREVVHNDILSVVRAAADRAKAADTREISGHEIIDALSGVWGKLKTMAYNVWD